MKDLWIAFQGILRNVSMSETDGQDNITILLSHHISVITTSHSNYIQAASINILKDQKQHLKDDPSVSYYNFRLLRPGPAACSRTLRPCWPQPMTIDISGHVTIWIPHTVLRVAAGLIEIWPCCPIYCHIINSRHRSWVSFVINACDNPW